MPARLRQRGPHLFRQSLAVHYGAAASAAAHSIPSRFTRSPSVPVIRGQRPVWTAEKFPVYS